MRRNLLLCFAILLSVQTSLVRHARARPTILDGFSVEGGLVQGSDGSIYGATQSGGRTACTGQWGTFPNALHGCGTIFRIRPDGRAETTYRFRGEWDGLGPQGLALKPDGSLTGMVWASYGRSGYTAKVFWLSKTGGIKVRASSQQPLSHSDLAWNGSRYVGITTDRDVPFYAISMSGEITPLQVPALLQKKCGEPVSLGDGDNAISYGPASALDGAVYATTARCILRIGAPPDEIKVIHQTRNYTFVNTPRFDNNGNIYVAAWLKGSNDGSKMKRELEGIVLIDGAGKERTLATLPLPDRNSDANYITGFALGRDANLYGIAYLGGRSGDGMLFKVDAGGSVVDLHDFCPPGAGPSTLRLPGCENDDQAPFANLLAAQDGTIWGASDHGVFRYDPARKAFDYLVVFNGK